ncbi:hypothetical protein CERZMDRAFT_95871 [Cercospora zeae-maydis SCOH1-5]|uniref:Uncharacterized protein n=1 Tax=Cercospora zeae-maydis SCOH1-5 TaxID=717836 RepID=A0A6A6FKF9_9PEZI|nr:hypothetical protein CERZMDRAFT_95871 [Cercospora zeae-maydis SCOH1-5]
MKLTIFALAGLAAATAVPQHRHVTPHVHHHVDLVRFSTTDCAKGTAIGATHTIKRGDCSTFRKHKGKSVAAVKATISHNRMNRIGLNENCRVVLYSEEKCKGEEVPTDDMWLHNGQCRSAKNIAARSVKLKCWKTTNGAHEGPEILVEEDEVEDVVLTTIKGAQGHPAQTRTVQQAATQSSDGIIFLTGPAQSKSLVTIHVPITAATPQVLTVQQQPEPQPVTTIQHQPAPKPVVTIQQQPAPKPVVTVQQQPGPGPAMTIQQQPAPKPVVTIQQQPAPRPVVTIQQQPAPKPVVTVQQQPAPKPPVVTIQQQPGPGPAMTIHHPHVHKETIKVITLTIPVTEAKTIHWTTVTTTMGLSEFLAQQTAKAKPN